MGLIYAQPRRSALAAGTVRNRAPGSLTSSPSTAILRNVFAHHFAHYFSSASITRSIAMPREPFTSRTSPGRTTPRTMRDASALSAVINKVGGLPSAPPSAAPAAAPLPAPPPPHRPGAPRTSPPPASPSDPGADLTTSRPPPHP